MLEVEDLKSELACSKSTQTLPCFFRLLGEPTHLLLSHSVLSQDEGFFPATGPKGVIRI